MNRMKMVATDGMVLTNGETYGREVFICTGDSPDNWYEITVAAYEKILAEQEENYEENLYQPRPLR